MHVLLTPDECRQATEAGKLRNKSQRDGSRADGKVVEDSLGIDVQGAHAELAVAKGLGLQWDGRFFNLEEWFDWRNEGHDVSGLEVRSTHHPHGSLILHPTDKNEAPFVLVLTHKKPEYILAGWNFGSVGKVDKYWRDVGYGRPCYYLPQRELKTMDLLVTRLRKVS